MPNVRASESCESHCEPCDSCEPGCEPCNQIMDIILLSNCSEYRPNNNIQRHCTAICTAKNLLAVKVAGRTQSCHAPPLSSVHLPKSLVRCFGIALYFYSFVGLKKSRAIENRDSSVIFKFVGKV